MRYLSTVFFLFAATTTTVVVGTNLQAHLDVKPNDQIAEVKNLSSVRLHEISQN